MNAESTTDFHRFNGVLRYEPETGKLFWKVKRGSRAAGSQAGTTVTQYGYLQVGAFSKVFFAHRVAFLLMTGNWPSEFIDHINRDRSDNRWSNLREATVQENNCNTGARTGSATGIKNVYLTTNQSGNRYAMAAVQAGGRVVAKTFSFIRFGEAGAIDMAEQYVNSIRHELHGSFSAN